MASEEKRARRRRDLERMKAKARRIYPHDPKAKTAEYLAVCSCAVCGNARRYEKADRLTMQERRAETDWGVAQGSEVWGG